MFVERYKRPLSIRLTKNARIAYRGFANFTEKEWDDHRVPL